MASNINIAVNVDAKQGVATLGKLSDGFNDLSRKTATALGVNDGFNKSISNSSTEAQKASNALNQSGNQLDKLTTDIHEQTKARKEDSQATQRQKELMSQLDAQIEKLDADYRHHIKDLELGANNYLEFSTRVELTKKNLGYLRDSLQQVDFNDVEENAQAFAKVNQKIRESSNALKDIKGDIKKVAQENDNAAKLTVFNEALKRAEITKSGMAIFTLGKQQIMIEKQKLDQIEKYPALLNRVVNSYEKVNAVAKLKEPLQEAKIGVSSLKSELMSLAYSLGGAFSVKGVFDTAQEVGRLRNELQLTVKPGEDATDMLNELFYVANNAKQPIDAAVSAYNTFKKNTLELGLSQKQLRELTETTTKAIAIGGSSADQAKNSMIQFGQALSLGKLSGQNFNSVAEQTPGLVDAIAKGLGMTAAQLKNYANDGKLTTDEIVTALTNAKNETDTTFNSLGASVTGSLNLLRNNFMKFVGETDFYSSKIASMIEFTANHLNANGNC